MTSMLRGGKNDGWAGLCFAGCSCHNTKADHRRVKKSIKAREKRAWQKDARE